MPFVKIHLSTVSQPQDCARFVDDVRRALVEVLGIKPDHGHVVVYASSPEMRCCHEHRDQGFVFVEILMFRGRSHDRKEKLFRVLSNIVQDHTGVPDRDILLNIIDTDHADWAGHGGIPMSKHCPED